MYDLFAFVFQNSFLLRGTVLFVFGTIIGSFLNVVIYRLPVMLKNKWHNECVELLGENTCPIITERINLMHPSSHCPSCKAKIPFWANVPILGYFLLNAKCFNCKTKISVRYPLIELATGLLFLTASYLSNDTLILPALLVFLSFSVCLILIDYDTYILPDELTLTLMWLGILINLHGLFSGSLENSILGAVGGYMLFWSIFWIFKIITKRDGMGYGDFKFLAAILAWIGYRGLIPITLMASMLGILYFIAVRISMKITAKNDTPDLLKHQIPFGPFLGSAGILFMFADKYFINLPW